MNPSQKTSPNKIKTARIGSYSVVITVVVIVMAILVNLIVNRLPTTYTQFDVSSAGLYTLSEQTESMVSGLDQDITIYWIVQTGNENNSIQRLLDRYQVTLHTPRGTARLEVDGESIWTEGPVRVLERRAAP